MRFQTQTKDINPSGFYCRINQLIQPWDPVACDIAVPAHDRRYPEDVVYLRCKIRAVRVEAIPDSAEFGLACRIEDYRIISAQMKIGCGAGLEESEREGG